MTAPVVEHTVHIDASPDEVWKALTEPAQMTRWMGEPETQVQVDTDWRVGGVITVRGFHHARFTNRGTVLAFDPPRLVRYNHLSSLSRLPDVPGSYTVLEFRLAPDARGTSLTVRLSGFPTESILRHLDFYWRGTVVILKRFVERSRTPS